MRIKFILFNILLLIILFTLIYLYLYINYSNYEGFQDVVNNTYNKTQIDTIYADLLLRDNTTIRDGSTSALAFNSANSILYYNDTFKNSGDRNELKDGYYWINLPIAGPQYIYCITDTSYYGGGWMLALRGVKGSTNFGYDSKHWTSETTFNSEYNSIKQLIDIKDANLFEKSSIGNKIFEKNLNPNMWDAKFNTFNHTPAKEWMAIFYNKAGDKNIIGGDLTPNNRGWIWYENKILYDDKFDYTLLELFRLLQKRNSMLELYNLSANNVDPDNFTKIKPYNNIRLWSFQRGYKKYAINYNISEVLEKTHNRGAQVRWGFAWNNELDPHSNDVYNGIGVKYRTDNKGNSAGDFIYCCESEKGLNDSMAFEWYIR